MLVGIDLGTTFSLIAYVGANGTPTLCPSRVDAQRFLTPSVIHVGARGALVGDLVEQLLEEEPALPICRFAKLSMGTAATVLTDQEGFAYRAETASALVLKKLKLDAEAATGESISGAVITVPAHFNDAQRQATIDAARLADLPLRGLVEEPVAAAAYFGHHAKDAERTIFVFDLGGGTLDATILQATPTGLYVLATEGSANIGGKNFDEVIMALAREQFRSQFAKDFDGDPESLQRLRTFATGLKIELSKPGIGSVARPVILGGRPMRVTVSRAQFEKAAQPWLEASTLVCAQVLKASGLAWADIDELVLTGGSSLVPCVQLMLRELSKLPSGRMSQDQPHAAVAYGAAVLCEQQYGDRQTIAPPLRQSVTTNELGIRAFDNDQRKVVFQPLIHKNVAVPVTRKQTVYTRTDEQTSVAIEVVQRKDALSPPEELGTFTFGPLAKPQRNSPIDVAIGFNEIGRVTVSATDVRSGERVEHAFAGAAQGDLDAQYERIRAWTIKG
jgi:molecular chaperone DnaK